MKFTKFILAATILMLGFGIATKAEAHKKWQEVTRYDIMTNEKLQKRLSVREIQSLHRYFDYEDREPCQQYEHIDHLPKGFKVKDCALWTQHFKKPNYMKDTVHFASGSAVLSASEKAKVHKMARKAAKSKSGKVVLKGFTDTVGDKMSNSKLSHKRVMAVKKIFNAHGVHDRHITMKHYGESKLAVKTSDGVANRSNRRVKMKIYK